MITEVQRICKNPGCTNRVPPRQPGRKARLTCCDDCRKAASRAHLREVAQRREEAARQARLAHWQVFQPTTRLCLERVEALGGPALAEQLAEAIRRERDRPIGKALAEPYTGGVEALEAPDSCFARCKRKHGVACKEGDDDG